jgi:hypothetical protein
MIPIKGMFAIRGNHSVFLSRAKLIRSTNKIRLLFIAIFSKINTGEPFAFRLRPLQSFGNSYSDKLYSLSFSDKEKQILNSLSTISALVLTQKNLCVRFQQVCLYDRIKFRFNHSLA